ncbi:MAG: response regulator transcription factor [Dehalococcoidales bacterium]|nr:response regulator transcription factor [Dehalococcoidales bacterium]
MGHNVRDKNVITVLLVDDHPLVRSALKNLIETQDDMKVVAEANTGEEAIEMAARLQPDVIIMDIGMPGINGLEATKQIKLRNPNIAILVLTVYTDNEHIFGILKAGAAGYLTKMAVGNDVIKAIQAIYAGETVLTPSVLQQILSSVTSEPVKTVPSYNSSDLTSREVFVLKLAAKGLSNKSIAAELNLSEYTVKSYLATTFSKIRVSSRTEAVMVGLKAGFISLSDLE